MMFRSLIAGSMAAWLVAPGALGATRYVSFSTWMRAGPAASYPVLDEIPAGWPVEVDGCDGGWCRVVVDRAPGYMPERLLSESRPALPAAKAGGGCVPGQWFTPEGPLRMRLCAAER